MGIKEELGEKIKRMRVNRGFTQEELAETIDISQRGLSAIERGENFVTAETLDKLLIALNVTGEELFATTHLKSSDELIAEINRGILKINSNPIKLEILYNIVKSLLKEWFNL